MRAGFPPKYSSYFLHNYFLFSFQEYEDDESVDEPSDGALSDTGFLGLNDEYLGPEPSTRSPAELLTVEDAFDLEAEESDNDGTPPAPVVDRKGKGRALGENHLEDIMRAHKRQRLE